MVAAVFRYAGCCRAAGQGAAFPARLASPGTAFVPRLSLNPRSSPPQRDGVRLYQATGNAGGRPNMRDIIRHRGGVAPLIAASVVFALWNTAYKYAVDR